MPHPIVDILSADDPAVRDRPLERAVAGLGRDELLAAAVALDRHRRAEGNLYRRVRALAFLNALHAVHLPACPDLPAPGRIPARAVAHLLDRRFEEAVDGFLDAGARQGPSAALCSALAAGYRALAFDTLAEQVRTSVRALEGNRWMFATTDPASHPLRLRDELLARDGHGRRRALVESTPVRMDLSHSAWSDIFFLAMDDPEGARVLNVSVDLGVSGRDSHPRPPIRVSLEVIDEPVLVLSSVDLDETARCETVADVFDLAKDHLGLLRAGVIAAGLVPPGLEGGTAPLAALLDRVVGPGLGLSLRTAVRGIPKGSRLAVSTNLLASILAVVMRATGQTRALTGPLDEPSRRLACARAILGEWLGGSGGGWQDSAGLWPGAKIIRGVPAGADDPEHGVSRGRLLPEHEVLGTDAVGGDVLSSLADSLVLCHGGMAQDVGPVLEMVTERYLLRTEDAWNARRRARVLFDEITGALRHGDVRRLGAATHENFFGPIRTIIPWASNDYTERVVGALGTCFGDAFLGFWMLGGMAGGGMGFLFDPERGATARSAVLETLVEHKRACEHAVPFAMDPVVYDLRVNETGSVAAWSEPGHPEDPPRPPPPRAATEGSADLETLLAANGFDPALHEAIRTDLRSGRIGLARNRLPAETTVEDVAPAGTAGRPGARPSDLLADTTRPGAGDDAARARGQQALAAGRLALVTLAAGSGSRWTGGAGVVKALAPVARLGGAFRSFLDVHRARTRRAERLAGGAIPWVVTTGHLTHDPIASACRRDVADGTLRLSRSRVVGLRLVPTERDLRFAWEHTARQTLDERAERVRASLEEALCAWARRHGEGSDYRDNEPHQCLHPVGHFYEVPNLLLNGTLADLLEERPSIDTLLVHNVDTLGASPDPVLLGRHLGSGATATFEVVARRLEDRGGGLARIDGRLRLVESLALPREEDELSLSYYNAMTTWLDVDGFLAVLGLDRARLRDGEAVRRAVTGLAARLPTYVTLKDVKKRWGHGHEDVFPVAQFERLWGDITTLDDVGCRYVIVPRWRGRQLKEPAQLDGWLRDGTAATIEALCDWD